MLRSSLVPGIAVTFSLCATGISAQSAHVHGEGRLNIAIDGNRLFIELESPGADIVGFEHTAASSAEKAAVAAALERLANPAAILRLDDNAKCRVIENTAEFESDLHEGDEHRDHDQHGKNDERHDPSEHDHENDEDHEHDGHDEAHDHGDHEAHADETRHSAFVARYVYDCGASGALEKIEFTYFERFESAQSLNAVLIDGGGQRRMEVGRDNPVLRLVP